MIFVHFRTLAFRLYVVLILSLSLNVNARMHSSRMRTDICVSLLIQIAENIGRLGCILLVVLYGLSLKSGGVSALRMFLLDPIKQHLVPGV